MCQRVKPFSNGKVAVVTNPADSDYPPLGDAMPPMQPKRRQHCLHGRLEKVWIDASAQARTSGTNWGWKAAHGVLQDPPHQATPGSTGKTTNLASPFEVQLQSINGQTKERIGTLRYIICFQTAPTSLELLSNIVDLLRPCGSNQVNDLSGWAVGSQILRYQPTVTLVGGRLTAK